MSWRPEGWDTKMFNLRVPQGRKLEPHERDWALTSLKLAREFYEAGADVMLKSVCEEIEKGLLTDDEINLELKRLTDSKFGGYRENAIASLQLQKIRSLFK